VSIGKFAVLGKVVKVPLAFPTLTPPTGGVTVKTVGFAELL